MDVRRFPGSRRVPQFNADALGPELTKQGINYTPLPALGGRRKPRADSINAAWRNASFRGYADYMQTPAFEQSLKQLIEIATKKPTVIMCAEAVPWRCHRSLIADALVARGWQVIDLVNERSTKLHKLPDYAKVQGTQVTYPASGASSDL